MKSIFWLDLRLGVACGLRVLHLRITRCEYFINRFFMHLGNGIKALQLAFYLFKLLVEFSYIQLVPIPSDLLLLGTRIKGLVLSYRRLR